MNTNLHNYPENVRTSAGFDVRGILVSFKRMRQQKQSREKSKMVGHTSLGYTAVATVKKFWANGEGAKTVRRVTTAARRMKKIQDSQRVSPFGRKKWREQAAGDRARKKSKSADQ